MKKILLSTMILGLAILFCGNIFAQSWGDVIQEEKGDTVVVKGTTMTGGTINTLWIAVLGDTTSTGARTNPNRVYETIPGEIYLTDGTLEVDASVPVLKIVAPPIDRNGSTMPPLHIKQVQVDGSFDKTFFQTPGSIYMSNQYFCLALTNETLDREHARALGDNQRYEYDNCVFEFTNWVLHHPRGSHQTYKYTNCLFINIGNEPTLEKGLVFDAWISVDTLWMENNTVLNAGGVTLMRPDCGPDFAYFNHNTFVNTTLNPMLFYTQAEMIATNNIIINTGIVPDYPGFYEFHEDDDQLPKGIINVDTVEADWISTFWPDGYPVTEANRKILVDKNDTWWDSRFQNMFEQQLPAFPDSIDQTWISQMINMNSRTEAMFADDAGYPYFVQGTWYNVEPNFTNNKDMVSDWISFIVSNSTPGTPGGGDGMPWWRTNMTTNLYTPDWPPLADLSFSDATLMAGGVNKYPLGDLNWYSAYKEQWDETGESAKLIEAMKAGELPTNWDEVDPISGIKKVKASNLNVSVYPNPFTSMVNVKYELTSGTNVELILYNLVGEKVRVKELGYQTMGRHEVTLDKGDLSSGMYILHVNTDDNQLGLATKITIK